LRKARTVPPFCFRVGGRPVGFEVVREDYRRIARDVFVAGVRRSDSNICSRCRWGEKCDYSRKREKPDTSEFCEPHECVAQLKARHSYFATNPNGSVFIFRPTTGIPDLLIIRPRQPS